MVNLHSGNPVDVCHCSIRSDDGSTRPQSRGGKGRLDIRTTSRNGPVVTIACVNESDGLMFMSKKGMIVRVPAASISQIGRNTQGVRLVNLKDGDLLIGCGLGAQVPVDELETLLRLSREQRVGIAYLRKDAPQRLLLALRVPAPVPRMRDQVLGPDASEFDYAVADVHKHILCDPATYNRPLSPC